MAKIRLEITYDVHDMEKKRFQMLLDRFCGNEVVHKALHQYEEDQYGTNRPLNWEGVDWQILEHTLGG